MDLSQLGVTRHGSFTVEVIDPVADYLELLQVRRRVSPLDASGIYKAAPILLVSRCPLPNRFDVVKRAVNGFPAGVTSDPAPLLLPLLWSRPLVPPVPAGGKLTPCCGGCRRCSTSSCCGPCSPAPTSGKPSHSGARPPTLQLCCLGPVYSWALFVLSLFSCGQLPVASRECPKPACPALSRRLFCPPA